MNKQIVIIISLTLFSLSVLAQTKNYDTQIVGALANKDTATAVSLLIEKLNTSDPEHAEMPEKMSTNNQIFEFLFKYSHNKKQLTAGAVYMKKLINGIVEEKTDKIIYANFIDTYSNVLYKIGRVKKAINWQEKAVSMAPESLKPELQLNLEKMKKRIPTWPVRSQP